MYSGRDFYGGKPLSKWLDGRVVLLRGPAKAYTRRFESDSSLFKIYIKLMHYTKEGIVEVREDVFNQLREENSLLIRENIILRNKLDVAIRLCEAWKKILERRKAPPIRVSDFQ